MTFPNEGRLAELEVCFLDKRREPKRYELTDVDRQVIWDESGLAVAGDYWTALEISHVHMAFDDEDVHYLLEPPRKAELN